MQALRDGSDPNNGVRLQYWSLTPLLVPRSRWGLLGVNLNDKDPLLHSLMCLALWWRYNTKGRAGVVA
jgi:hypothetical protein